MSQNYDYSQPLFYSDVVSEVVRNNFQAASSCHSGLTEPINPVDGMLWEKLTPGNHVLYKRVGSVWVRLNGTVVFEQLVANNTWVITHDFYKEPNVMLITNAGDPIWADTITYDSDTQITITFTVNMTGKAFLN